jgi:RNA polymerase sigma-70 factor (ECF subfamily)
MEVELQPMDGSSMNEPHIADPSLGVAQRELIDDALRRLDPTWRAVVVLHFFLGMSLPEAAATLGIPLGTAKSRLHRSLGVLRSLMAIDEAASATPLGGPVA